VGGPREYSAGTRAALPMLSAGRCYFPGCMVPILRFIDDPSKGIAPEPYIDYQIAHIRDAKPGNRYDPTMTDPQRAAFSNLILLCKPHHNLVDKTHPEEYSSADLESWKVARESKRQAALANLGVVGEEELASLLRETAREQQHEAAMRDLTGTAADDTAGLVHHLGAAVVTLPSSSDEAIAEFLRRLGDLDWIRQDWNAFRDSMFTRTRFLRSAIDRLNPVLDAFADAISDVNGYRRASSFLASRSLCQAFIDEGLSDKFVVEIRQRLRSLIVHRSVAQALLLRAQGFAQHPTWGDRPLESLWDAPAADTSGKKLWRFAVSSTATGFSFRATTTFNTLDLYGLREGWRFPTAEPLVTALVDPPYWWMVLVPCGVEAAVQAAVIRSERSIDAEPALDSIRELVDPGNFIVQ